MKDSKEMKMKAKKDVAMALKRMMMDEMRSPMKDHLGKSKMKVVVGGDTPEEVEEGLSLAEQILKAKLNKGGEESEGEELDDDSDEEGEDFACGGTKKAKRM